MTSGLAGSGPMVPLTVTLPAGAYSVEVVQRAIYALMAKIDVRISSADRDIVCDLRPLINSLDAGEIELTFMRELVDQALRLSIESRTEAYRDLILGLAFSRTGLQDG